MTDSAYFQVAVEPYRTNTESVSSQRECSLGTTSAASIVEDLAAVRLGPGDTMTAWRAQHPADYPTLDIVGGGWPRTFEVAFSRTPTAAGPPPLSRLFVPRDGLEIDEVSPVAGPAPGVVVEIEQAGASTTLWVGVDGPVMDLGDDGARPGGGPTRERRDRDWAPSPSGRRRAHAGPPVRVAEGGAAVTLHAALGGPSTVRWIDDRYLVLYTDEELWLADADLGRSWRVLPEGIPVE